MKVIMMLIMVSLSNSKEWFMHISIKWKKRRTCSNLWAETPWIQRFLKSILRLSNQQGINGWTSCRHCVSKNSRQNILTRMNLTNWYNICRSWTATLVPGQKPSLMFKCLRLMTTFSRFNQKLKAKNSRKLRKSLIQWKSFKLSPISVSTIK